MLLVALSGWNVEQWVDRLQKKMPGRKIVALGESFDRSAVRYAVSWKHPVGSLVNLPNLSAIFSLGAGVDFLFNDDRLPDVPIYRVVDADLTNRMSEYVVMHCLMLLRQTRRYEAQQKEILWDDDRFQPAAADIRVGIMGMGELGQDAAHKLKMMGFQVAGWSRTPKQIDGVTTYSGETGLSEFLARTDILVVLLPLTPQTRGIIDERLIRGLAQDGRLDKPALINAGRGGLQKEAGILKMLNDGVLGHAVLDVFETEPLPRDSLLWTHPLVTVTPHNAAMSDPDAIGALVARQIAKLEAGQEPDYRVDRTRAY
jgi:glyoxylate/hydroxypyruvate reductase A